MSKIYTSMLQLIGNTPLLKPERYNNAAGVAANLLVKLDAFNPAGSAKDRIAKAMIEDAEKKGILKKGSVIIEPTSGNTGIGRSCCQRLPRHLHHAGNHVYRTPQPHFRLWR
jgi:cysteine synthase A